jgi:glycosyltransferase involved in cell wall biosynthesis
MSTVSKGSLRETRILYEGVNLTLGAGTGIATYARVLGRTARSMGYATDILVSSRAGTGGKDPVLGAVGLFDQPLKRRSYREVLRTARTGLLGEPFGIRANRVRGLEALDPGLSGDLRTFDRVYAARNLIDRAKAHVDVHGRLAKLKLEDTPDIFHATQPAGFSVAGCANLYTIHDLVPIRLPNATLDNKRVFWKVARLLCREADHIVTVSEHSRRDIIELCGIEEDRVTNTYQAVEAPVGSLEMTDDDVAKAVGYQFGLDHRGYFLFFANLEPKKNVARLISAYAESGSDLPLVIAGGPGWSNEREVEMIEDERFVLYRLDEGTIRPMRRVRRLEYLPAGQLATLVRGARAVVFPSLYEGFGLPAVEAMLLGTPVLTSTAACMPEIVADAAELVDPYDVSAIAAGIRRLEQDADRRSELVEAGYARASFFSREAYEARMNDLYGKFS